MAMAIRRAADEGRWRPRRAVSWAIRVGVLVVPVGLGLVASLLVSRALPPPRTAAADLLWWAVLISCVLAVVLVATAGCRRFLPLASLLDLSLLFPDRA